MSALLLLVACRCDDGQGSSPQSSGATNWLRCGSDADCERYPGARCFSDGYCVDENGARVVASDAAGASSGGAGPDGPRATGGSTTGGSTTGGSTSGGSASALGEAGTAGASDDISSGGAGAGNAGVGAAGSDVGACQASTDCGPEERCRAPFDITCGDEPCAACAIPLSVAVACGSDTDCADAGTRTICSTTCRLCVEPCESDDDCQGQNGHQASCAVTGRCVDEPCDVTPCEAGYVCTPVSTTGIDPMTYYQCFLLKCEEDADCPAGSVCVTGVSGARQCAPEPGTCEPSPSFLCGETERCTSAATQYCEAFTAGPAGPDATSYACRELPATCAGVPSCECIADASLIQASCELTIDGHVLLTLPPAP